MSSKYLDDIKEYSCIDIIALCLKVSEFKDQTSLIVNILNHFKIHGYVKEYLVELKKIVNSDRHEYNIWIGNKQYEFIDEPPSYIIKTDNYDNGHIKVEVFSTRKLKEKPFYLSPMVDDETNLIKKIADS